MNLSWKDLEIRANGNIKLKIGRTKNDVITESFLTSPAIDIANKYKNHSECQLTGNILPKQSNKELNSQLKLISTLAKLPVKTFQPIGYRIETI